MNRSFNQLFLEPDIPSKIFTYLSDKDLDNIELVCKEWRRIVIETRIWGRRL